MEPKATKGKTNNVHVYFSGDLREYVEQEAAAGDRHFSQQVCLIVKAWRAMSPADQFKVLRRMRG